MPDDKSVIKDEILAPDTPVQIAQPQNTATAPIVENLSPITVSHDTELPVSAPEVKKNTQKRKRDATPPTACSTIKKAKTVNTKQSRRKPWNLLLDGERRLGSLRSSSCDSAADQKVLPKTSTAKQPQVAQVENHQTELVKVLKTEQALEPAVSMEKPQISIQTRRMTLRSSSCDSGAENSKSQTPPMKRRTSRKDSTNSQKVSPKSPGIAAKAKLVSGPSQGSGTEEKSPAAIIKKEQLNIVHKRRLTLRSSSCDSGVEPSQELKNLKKKSRTSMRLSGSDCETSKAPPTKKTTKVQEMKNSDSDSGPNRMRRRSSKVIPIKPTSDESEFNQVENEVPSSDSEAPLITTRRSKNVRNNARSKNVTPKKTIKKKTTSKILDSDSDSEFDDRIDPDSTRNTELKSRLSPIDLNSKPKSRIFIRNDYLHSPDRQTKTKSGLSLMMDKLSTTIEKRKAEDSTYIEPPTFVKRERLRTSAFKGNLDESSNDEDSQDSNTRRSVSHETSVSDLTVEKYKPTGFKRGRQKKVDTELYIVEKKKFVQEALEDAIESLVPYDEILKPFLVL